MRGEDGELVGGDSELKGIWKGYFEQLMNNEAEGEAVATSMGMDWLQVVWKLHKVIK